MQPLILPYEGHWPEIAPDAFVAPDVTLVGRVKISTITPSAEANSPMSKS